MKNPRDQFSEEELLAATTLYKLKYEKLNQFTGLEAFLDVAAVSEPYASEIVRLVHDDYIDSLYEDLYRKSAGELWELIKGKSAITEEQYRKDTQEDALTELVVLYIAESRARAYISQNRYEYGEVLNEILKERKEIQNA